MRNAQYAFSKYIEGKEKAYMVEAAISDLIAAYQTDDLNAVIYARKSLAEDDEGERKTLMALALKDVLTHR